MRGVFAQTSAMTKSEKQNHGEVKNYDEPESYRKIKETESLRYVE